MTELTIAEQTYSVNKIYYISPNGSDDNDGLTEDTPLLTYMYANSIAGTGDAICFLPGNHVYNLNISEVTTQEQSGIKHSVILNDCLVAYRKRELTIYSKSLEHTTITFNIDCPSEPVISLTRIQGGNIVNCHIIFNDNLTEVTNFNTIMWYGAYGHYSEATINNSIIEFSSKLPVTFVNNTVGGTMHVTQSTIINHNGSWGSNSAACELSNVVSNIAIPGDRLNNNVMVSEELTEQTMFSSYYYNDIEVGAVLPVNYLLLNNGNYYIIDKNHYDLDTGMYVPVSSIDSIKLYELDVDSLTAKQTYLSDLRPIDKFSGEIKLIHEFDSLTTVVNGLKTTMELVVAKDNIPLSIVDTINSITLNYSTLNDGEIKIAVSTDNGNTWLTYNPETDLFETLDVSIPTTPYETMTAEELDQWNVAKETIYASGIDISAVTTIDFNKLKNDETGTFDDIKFAYVLSRPTYEASANTTALSWDFNAKGHMKLMNPAVEYDADVYDKHIVFTSLIDNSIIKVNIIM